MLTPQAQKKRQKYLGQYAEPIVGEIANVRDALAHYSLENALVIPAYKETDCFINRLASSPLAKQNACFFVVINQPDSDSDSTPQQLLFRQAVSMGEEVASTEQCTFIALSNSNSLLVVVDCFTQPLPKEQGVGLARKIGCDLVIAMAEQGTVNATFIGSTDADAYLPNNYFDVMTNLDSATTSGVCYGFHHCFQEKTLTDTQLRTQKATQAYEQAMAYYVAGLTYARSPYAFFTIGSILAISTIGYVDVRGFVKKSAGEDFYTLNKLAKLGKIAQANEATIYLTPRLSDRVPFGTGPAVKDIIALEQANEAYCYYHPQCFVELKHSLEVIHTLTHDTILEKVLDAKKDRGKISDIVANEINVLSTYSKKALEDIGFIHFLIKQLAQNANNQKQLTAQIANWFDAFKTLKYIHSIKQEYNDIPLVDAISNAPFNLRQVGLTD